MYAIVVVLSEMLLFTLKELPLERFINYSVIPSYMPNDKGFLYRTLHAIENNLVGVIIGAVILGGAATWVQQMYSAHEKAQVEMVRIQVGLELKVGDYNGNPLLDKYYEINGQKVPVEVDGKPIADYFKK